MPFIEMKDTWSSEGLLTGWYRLGHVESRVPVGHLVEMSNRS